MRVLLFALRAPCVAVWIVLGLLTEVCVFPLLSLSARGAVSRTWSRVLMCLCGVRIRVCGAPVQGAPVLWVANHVSWVDIFVLNSVRCTAFVAKSDIRRWPVLGWLVAGAGTVFIERGQRQAIRAVGRQMAERFRRGEVVGLFPEGTTSPGFDVAPFHSSLFEAAIQAGVDVQPVALRFLHRGRRSDLASFVGEQNLIQNLWCLLGATGVEVEADFLAPLRNEDCRARGRASTAAQVHRAIRAAVVAEEPAQA
ncbi:lysophospholipid acyltransferase family protein [Candidimonas nitroreducens]|uniref:1-acyl-sn-glycerol-3-phosphate acyltransferase n=1 Tax=Candidimonas nitroreducens TaxID=683354 RepID=A0A225MH15_9BURK|nr:1-acyl-sn-glycerol-3-phosphate acyltransferase [Candidimonas nitroreducens]OWT58209.1 1-acyl-sn-glycerol-3-phosphate acyltransferase [Candidimonas nitroreducens]